MEDNLDAEFAEGLRRLARVETADEIPTAAVVWSRSQFRLRYYSRTRRRGYASTAGTAVAALYLLVFLCWNLRSGSIELGVLLTVAVVATSALLLSWMIRRTVGG